MNLSRTISRDIFPQLEGLCQVGTGALLGVTFAVIRAAGVGQEHHIGFKGFCLDGHVSHGITFAADTKDTEAIVKYHLRHPHTEPSAVFTCHTKTTLLRLLGAGPGKDVLLQSFPVQLVLHHYIASHPKGCKNGGVIQLHGDGSLVTLSQA